MKRLMILGATLAASLAAPLASSAGGPGTVTCPQDTQTFTGTARTLIVPTNGYCAITNATITGDLILQDDAGADLLTVSVGHDMRGGVDAGAGIVNTTIGHDLSLQGGDGGAELSDTKIGHDYSLTAGAGTQMQRTTIGHDFTASQPSTVQTGRNGPDDAGGPVSVGHDFLIDGTPPDNPFVFDGICT